MKASDYDDLPPSAPVVWMFRTNHAGCFIRAKVWFNARRLAMRMLRCEATELVWQRVDSSKQITRSPIYTAPE